MIHTAIWKPVENLMVEIEYQIDGAELRRRIDRLAAYVYVDPLRLPPASLANVTIAGLVVPDGPVPVRVTFDETRLAALPGGDDPDDAVEF